MQKLFKGLKRFFLELSLQYRKTVSGNMSQTNKLNTEKARTYNNNFFKIHISDMPRFIINLLFDACSRGLHGLKIFWSRTL